MSVPESVRHKGRLEVHVKAQALAAHTAHIISNPKVFNPEVDKLLLENIKQTAYDIYTKSWMANKIHAEVNKINRDMRYKYQEEAILLCDKLHAYIGIAKTVYHVRHQKIRYWSGLITEVRNLLQAWKESDVKRYGQP